MTKSDALSKSTQRGDSGPVRVCYVIDNLNVAGTELNLVRLIGALDRSKVVPYLCLLDGESELSQRLEPSDCAVLRLGIKSLRRPTTLGRAWQFARFLRSNNIDIVQTFFPDSTYFGVAVARLARTSRVIQSKRDLGYWLSRRDRWLGWAYGRWVDRTLANCDACRQAVIINERAPADTVIVLENGIDLGPFEGIPSIDVEVPRRPRRVGMVANLRPEKGPDVFVRAAAMVAEKHSDVLFEMAGTGDDAAVRQLAAKCGIGDRLRLAGRVEDIPGFLSRLDVAALTSRSEGLSNALLEYMAAARPIVATAVGGNIELIRHNLEGLLAPSENAVAVADAVCRLLKDSSLARQLGCAAKMRIVERHSLQAIAGRHESLYSNLLGMNRSSGSGGQST